MAMNMDALLRIAARATGGEQVEALGKKIQQVEGVTSRLTKATGLLGPALGALAPVATIGGLGALVKTQIEAADNFNDLSQRTGASVESLARFSKAADMSGTDIEAVSKSLARLSKGMYEAAQTGKGPTAEALTTLGISAKDAAGNLKSADQVTLEIANKFKTMPDGVQKTAIAMQLFGKAGADMIPMLNMGGDAIDNLSFKMTKAFAEKADQYDDKLASLSAKVGELAANITIALLPALELIVDGITAVVDVFSKLPQPIQAVIGLLGTLALGVAALAPALSLLAGTGLWTSITTAFTGFLTFVGTTFVPALLAFFTGPAGWITLAVIAVGAMVIAFREPIGQFLAWAGEQLGNLGKAIASTAAGIGNALKNGIIAGIELAKSALRGFLQFLASRLNVVVSLFNQIIRAYNRLPTPDFPEIPYVQIPQFATGAYVKGSTVAQVGEAGPEYVIPASRMAAASAAYLQGARGVDVVNGRGGAGGAAPSITIQTGPVMQQPDGSQWVSMGDLQAAMQATAAAVMGTLRTPGARVALRGA